MQITRRRALAFAPALTLLSCTSDKNNKPMNGITEQAWGALPSGETINLYTLRNEKGVEARISNFGGRLVNLKVPDRAGNFADIVLGYDSIEPYTKPNPFFGTLVGRYANRIANGEFTLDGKKYTLLKNNGPNSLHGGAQGFDKKAWQAEIVNNGQALQLTYLSKDGEEGFPGNLTSVVTYSLGNDNAFTIDYAATTDADTVLNLTNHSYFNLAGHGNGKILDHQLTVNADKFTPVNVNLIPTGELQNVAGTPFDFRTPKAIGTNIDSPDPQIQFGAGYDHNFVLNRAAGDPPSLAARITEPQSGRVMEVLTTQPGVQFYTANHINGEIKGKEGAIYHARGAYCFETQHFPDTPNQPTFPTAVLKPGEKYHQITIFRFSAA
jgi:aldose 1-epimerase